MRAGVLSPEVAAQLRLLECRPELAAQRDPEGNLPVGNQSPR